MTKPGLSAFLFTPFIILILLSTIDINFVWKIKRTSIQTNWDYNALTIAKCGLLEKLKKNNYRPIYSCSTWQVLGRFLASNDLAMVSWLYKPCLSALVLFTPLHYIDTIFYDWHWLCMENQAHECMSIQILASTSLTQGEIKTTE